VTRKQRSKLSDAPIAITSAGELTVGVTHLNGMSDVIAAAGKLVPPGHRVFVGVIVPEGLRATLMKEVDDALMDVAGRFGTLLKASSSALRAPSLRRSSAALSSVASSGRHPARRGRRP